MQTTINGIEFIADDEEAKMFLASHNRLQSLIPIDPFDHVAAVFCTDDAYCLATYDSGHPNAEDNGYTVLLIPKDAMSPEDAAQFIREARDAGKLYPDCPTVTTFGIDEPAFN